MIWENANRKHLLIRFNEYKQYSFISEHLACIRSTGSVWMLKTGKTIPEKKLQEILEDGGFLVMKAPKKVGGDYYFAHVVNIHSGKPGKSMVFPQYYYKLLDDENLWMLDSLEGSWLMIDSIERLSTDQARKLVLLSNGNIADDVIKTTRSATMYVTTMENFSTDEIE